MSDNDVRQELNTGSGSSNGDSGSLGASAIPPSSSQFEYPEFYPHSSERGMQPSATHNGPEINAPPTGGVVGLNLGVVNVNQPNQHHQQPASGISIGEQSTVSAARSSVHR